MQNSIVCRRLKGIMAENGITIKRLSEKIGISENGLTLKINGKRTWWYPEVLRTAKALGYEAPEDVFPEIREAVFGRKRLKQM